MIARASALTHDCLALKKMSKGASVNVDASRYTNGGRVLGGRSS